MVKRNKKRNNRFGADDDMESPAGPSRIRGADTNMETPAGPSRTVQTPGAPRRLNQPSLTYKPVISCLQGMPDKPNVNPPLILNDVQFKSYIDDFSNANNTDFKKLTDIFPGIYAIMDDIDLGIKATRPSTTFYPGIITNFEKINGKLSIIFTYNDPNGKQKKTFNDIHKIRDSEDRRRVIDAVTNYYLLCNDFDNYINRFVNMKIFGNDNYVSNLINTQIPNTNFVTTNVTTNVTTINIDIAGKIEPTTRNLILFRLLLLADTVKDFAKDYTKDYANKKKVNSFGAKGKPGSKPGKPGPGIQGGVKKQSGGASSEPEISVNREELRKELKGILFKQAGNDIKEILKGQKLEDVFNIERKDDFFEDVNPYLSLIYFIHTEFFKFIKDDSGNLITDNNVLKKYLEGKCESIQGFSINCIWLIDNPFELAKTSLYLLGYQTLDLQELEYFMINSWNKKCNKNIKSLPGFDALKWYLNLSSGNESSQSFTEECLNIDYFEKPNKPIIIGIDAVAGQSEISNVWKLIRKTPTYFFITPAQWVDGAGSKAKIIEKSLQIDFPNKDFVTKISFGGTKLIESSYQHKNTITIPGEDNQEVYTFALKKFFTLSESDNKLLRDNDLTDNGTRITIKPIKNKVYEILKNRKINKELNSKKTKNAKKLDEKIYSDNELVYAMVNKTMMDSNKPMFSSLIRTTNEDFNYLNITIDIIQSYITSIIGPGMSLLINKQFGAVEHVIVENSFFNFNVDSFSINKEDYDLTDPQKIKKLEFEIEKLKEKIKDYEDDKNYLMETEVPKSIKDIIGGIKESKNIHLSKFLAKELEKRIAIPVTNYKYSNLSDTEIRKNIDTFTRAMNFTTDNDQRKTFEENINELQRELNTRNVMDTSFGKIKTTFTKEIKYLKGII
jgi:hypothetical protein